MMFEVARMLWPSGVGEVGWRRDEKSIDRTYSSCARRRVRHGCDADCEIVPPSDQVFPLIVEVQIDLDVGISLQEFREQRRDGR